MVPRARPKSRGGAHRLRTFDRKGAAITQSKFTKSWDTLKRERPLNEHRVATYERLLEAQHRIARTCARLGATEAQIAAAFDRSEAPDPERLTDQELYFGTLAQFVAALGGRLDHGAVFGDERIELPGPAG